MNATQIDETTKINDLIQLVTFKIGKEEFGVEILQVQEIIKMSELTAIPNVDSYVAGIIKLRSKIVTVLDLRIKLGLSQKKYDNNTRIIVVEIKKTTIGFIVDEVKEVLRIPINLTEKPPSIVSSGVNSEYITGIGKLKDRMIILLTLENLLYDNELERVSELVDTQLEDVSLTI